MRLVFAELSLSWQITTWIIAGAFYFAAWIGFVLALRRELRERTNLRFYFEACRAVEFTDSENCQEITLAIGVTVTNMGWHPISVKKYACRVVIVRKGMRQNVLCSESLEAKHLKHGEHQTVFISIPSDPIDIDAVQVVDTTAKVWTASKKELRQLRSASRWAFPNMRQK